MVARIVSRSVTAEDPSRSARQQEASPRPDQAAGSAPNTVKRGDSHRGQLTQDRAGGRGNNTRCQSRQCVPGALSQTEHNCVISASRQSAGERVVIAATGGRRRRSVCDARRGAAILLQPRLRQGSRADPSALWPPWRSRDLRTGGRQPARPDQEGVRRNGRTRQDYCMEPMRPLPGLTSAFRRRRPAIKPLAEKGLRPDGHVRPMGHGRCANGTSPEPFATARLLARDCLRTATCGSSSRLIIRQRS